MVQRSVPVLLEKGKTISWMIAALRARTDPEVVEVLHHAADVEPLGPQDLAELDKGLLVLVGDARLGYEDKVTPHPLLVAVDVGARADESQAV